MEIGTNSTLVPENEEQFTLAYPSQYKHFVKGVIDYFARQNVVLFDGEGPCKKDTPLLRLLHLDEFSASLVTITQKGYTSSNVSLFRDSFSNVSDEKFLDLNNVQSVIFLRTDNPHFATLKDILVKTQHEVPSPASISFLSEKELSRFKDALEERFAARGQKLTIKKVRRGEGDQAITTLFFRVPSMQAPVSVCSAELQGNGARVHLTSTSAEAVEAREALHAVLSDRAKDGPPERLRSMSCLPANPDIDREPTPSLPKASGDLYAYDPEMDIFNHPTKLTEFLRATERSTGWKPAHEDVAAIRFHHVETTSDKAREIQGMREASAARATKKINPPDRWGKLLGKNHKDSSSHTQLQRLAREKLGTPSEIPDRK